MTRSLLQSSRIRASDSFRRFRRSGPSGQSTPVGATSFIDSPEPTPRKTRPGARHASVAKPCAIVDGWCRNVGVITLVPIVAWQVRSATAPIQANENGECPPVCRNGWK